MDVSQAGKLVIVAGVALIVLGVLMTFAGRLPLLGQMPGDFEIRRGNATIYFPLATMILLSLLLTIVLNFIMRR